jgi:hypothetical protein
MTPDVTSSSSGAEKAKPETPIARNANPAGLSTARPIADIPMKVEQGSGESATATTPETPIARNSNPAGVSTARTRE